MTGSLARCLALIARRWLLGAGCLALCGHPSCTACRRKAEELKQYRAREAQLQAAAAQSFSLWAASKQAASRGEHMHREELEMMRSWRREQQRWA